MSWRDIATAQKFRIPLLVKRWSNSCATLSINLKQCFCIPTEHSPFWNSRFPTHWLFTEEPTLSHHKCQWEQWSPWGRRGRSWWRRRTLRHAPRSPRCSGPHPTGFSKPRTSTQNPGGATCSELFPKVTSSRGGFKIFRSARDLFEYLSFPPVHPHQNNSNIFQNFQMGKKG